MTVGKEWKDRVSKFLIQYLDFPEEAWDDRGILTDEYIGEGIQILLKERVFEGLQDFQKTALRERDVFIPISLLYRYC